MGLSGQPRPDLVSWAASQASPLSEGLRNKLLDALFGAEEEFDYQSTPWPGAPAPAARPRHAGPRRPGPPMTFGAKGAHRAPSLIQATRSPVAMEAAHHPRLRSPGRRRSGSSTRCARPSGARRDRLDVRPRRARGGRLARAPALLLRHQGAAAGRGRAARLPPADGAHERHVAASTADALLGALGRSLRADGREPGSS